MAQPSIPTWVATVIDGVIALAIVAAATTLLALERIDAQTALALFGVAVVLVGGSAKALLALHVPAPAQAVVDVQPAATATLTPAPPPPL